MRSGAYAVNILNADQRSLSMHFASSVVDKFETVPWRAGEITGCPMLEGALAWVECKIAEIFSGGDHDIFLGHVASVQVHDGAPLVYWRGSYSSLPPPPEEESVARDNAESLDLPYA
jgi:flavin reductase (DIM6/NTAB) family NADH-FMN oxidoreductase RutF